MGMATICRYDEPVNGNSWGATPEFLFLYTGPPDTIPNHRARMPRKLVPSDENIFHLQIPQTEHSLEYSWKYFRV